MFNVLTAKILKYSRLTLYYEAIDITGSTILDEINIVAKGNVHYFYIKKVNLKRHEIILI